MEHEPGSRPQPAPAQTPPTPADNRQARRADTRDTLNALTKDARAVAARSQFLHDQAQRIQDDAHAVRARGPLPAAGAALTVPQASRVVGVCERTLRTALRRPDFAARLEPATRKVGTFYKTIPLLPPDLVLDLQAHFAAKKKPAPAPP